MKYYDNIVLEAIIRFFDATQFEYNCIILKVKVEIKCL
jgi:hypothetical protein